MALDIYKQTGDDLSASEFNQIVSEINSNGTAIGNKVDTALGKSLIADTEIARLATVSNQDISGKADASAVYTKTQSDAKYLSTGTTLFDGNYNNLTNKPSIPSLSGYATESWVVAKNFLTGVTWSVITSKPSFFDGDYNSLSNKPTIPSIAGLATTDYVDSEVLDLQTQIDNIAGGGEVDLGNYYTKSQSDGKYLSTGTTLFNGDYNGLSNKPTIPSISGLTTQTYVDGALAGKVNVDGSKVLTDNNYSSIEKSKLASIVSGATANSSDATLLNRPNHTGLMPASGLSQTSTARLVTDTQISNWSGKQDVITGTGYTYSTGAGITTINGGINDMLLGNGSFTSINPRIRIATIMGVSPTNSAIADNDSIVTAFNKLQGQLNVKQGNITLTTTGTTGAATLSGSTLNIPTPNLSTYLPISGSTSFISNSTDSFGSKVTNIVSCSQAQYDGLTPDANTFYIII